MLIGPQLHYTREQGKIIHQNLVTSITDEHYISRLRPLYYACKCGHP